MVRTILCDRCNIELKQEDAPNVFVLRWTDSEWEILDPSLKGLEPVDLCDHCAKTVSTFAKTKVSK